MDSTSVLGLILGVSLFLVTFSPSLLPRQWLGQGLVGGVMAAIGALAGFLIERMLAAVAAAVGLTITVDWSMPGGHVLLMVMGATLLAIGWSWSVREHHRTSQLVSMPVRPLWHDVAATLIALVILGLCLALIRGMTWLVGWLNTSAAVVLPSLLALVVALVITLLVLRTVNRVVFSSALQRISRQADRLDRRRPRGLTAPVLATRSGSPGAVQPWDELGRRGQIFTACGPDAATIARVTGEPALEPIRVYATLGDGGVERAVAVAMAEVQRTGALRRGTVVLNTPAGRGWVDEFGVQAVEYLTGGDCATISIQYSKLASAFVFLADRETPRACAWALFTAIEEALELLAEDRRPRIFVSGESLGAYGGHGAFVDADDMVARVSGALWIGTPGFTAIARQLTRSRMRGSPEITPVIDNGRHIRFVTRPEELTADAYGRLLGSWESPRIVYVAHASDPMARFTADLAWREPDWLRERAGRDVNPNLRWWPLVTWAQTTIDMMTSLDTPPGHGHIYEDELVPLWAAVLERRHAPVATIVDAIRASVSVLRRPTEATTGALASS